MNISKYIIKFLQSRDNNKKTKFGFYNFAEHLHKARGTPVKNQRCKGWFQRLEIGVSKEWRESVVWQGDGGFSFFGQRDETRLARVRGRANQDTSVPL